MPLSEGQTASAYINSVNARYMAKYSDFNNNSTDARIQFHPCLELITLIHEISHVMIAGNGPDNAYSLLENISVYFQIGLMRMLQLRDRRVNEYTMLPLFLLQNNSQYTNFVELAHTKTGRYPLIEKIDFSSNLTKEQYCSLAYGLPSFMINESIQDLNQLGERFGKLLQSTYQLEMLPIDTEVTYYPITDDIELTKTLLHNEKIFREFLDSVPIEDLYFLAQDFFELPENKQLYLNVKYAQAMFLNLVFGCTAEFCAAQLDLPEQELLKMFYVSYREDSGYTFESTPVKWAAVFSRKA